MKELQNLTLQEIDDLFRTATIAAKEEADAHDLPVVGIDENGNLIVHPGFDSVYKNRNVA